LRRPNNDVGLLRAIEIIECVAEPLRKAFLGLYEGLVSHRPVRELTFTALPLDENAHVDVSGVLTNPGE
jgi:hypothetical protein